jgi:hypothetical protein
MLYYKCASGSPTMCNDRAALYHLYHQACALQSLTHIKLKTPYLIATSERRQITRANTLTHKIR